MFDEKACPRSKGNSSRFEVHAVNTKRSVISLCSLALLAAIAAAPAAQESDTQPPGTDQLYVSDKLSITLRTGESMRHKILRMLPSGTPVEVLQSNPSNGYAKVRTESGTTGYVLERHLQSEPAARERVAEMQAQLEALRQAPDQLAAQLSTLQQEHEALQQRFDETEHERQTLEQELAALRRASANVVNISEERDALRSENAELKRTVGDLKGRNLELSNQSSQGWFLAGAGVVIAGIVIGLILPHLRLRRRKSSWGSL